MSQYISDVRPGRPFGDGTDGDLTISGNTTFNEPNVSCSGSSGTKTLTLGSASTFANGDVIFIYQTRGTGVGAWEVNLILSGGGSTTLTLLNNLDSNYTDSGNSQAQVTRIKEYNNFTVNGSVTWSVGNWDGDKGGILVFAARGTTAITGTISANGGNGSKSSSAGSGGASVGGFRGGGVNFSANGTQGEGSAGAASNSTAANGTGGGGGDGSDKTGGGGGHATSGGNGTGGTGGTTGGNEALTTLFFGGGGGGGTNDNSIDGAGGGGSGGGAIIGFVKSLTVTGSVVSNGGAGGAGFATNPVPEQAGGGGAGGSILFNCQTAVLGSSLITATGGAGGGVTAGSGGSGRIRVNYSNSISGSTNPALSSAVDGRLVESDGGGILLGGL